MSDTNNPTPRPHREITSNIEEDDLWDMDDDWASDEDDVIPEETPSEAPVEDPIEDPVAEATEEVPAIEEPTPDSTPAPVPAPADIYKKPEESIVADEPAETEVIAEEQTETSSDKEKTSKPASAPAKKISLPKLNLAEKVSLIVFAFAFLALGISSYVWLYKKNQTTKNAKLELPANGEHISISGFSTYWTTAKSSYEIKMGARVLPAADITLSSENNTSGALRINFRNHTDDIIGDPITLTVKDGKFAKSEKANITVDNDGLTAHVIASDGFHQEGDYSAYVLDEDLLWKIFVYEAGSASSTGSSFQKLIEYKVEPKRR